MKVNLTTTQKIVFAVFGVALVIAAIWIITGAGFSWFANWNVDRKVENGKKEASAEIDKAANANANAANYAVERRVEDEVREKVIKPRREAAKQKTDLSADDLRQAKKKYEKPNTENLSSNSADNCRELAGLYPDVRFEDCR